MLFTVLEDLKNSASTRGDKIVVVDVDTKLTFAQLDSRARLTAEALVDLGINPGDRVGVCMSKSADQIISILSVLYANGIFVPILPTLKYRNIDYIIKDSSMSAIITDEKRISEVEPHSKSVPILIGGEKNNNNFPSLPYISRYLTGQKLPIFNRLSVDVAAIIYSSGSTGMSKGIMVTHRNLYDGARIVARYLGTNERDRIAAVLSFNFDYGLNQIWQAFYTGCSIHIHELVLPNDCIRFLAAQKITALPLMPAIITRLFDPRFFDSSHQYDLSSVRYVCSSGGRVSNNMLTNIRKTFINSVFYSMYGLTEAFRSTYLDPTQLPNRPSSIGKAIPDVEILVVDEHGNECIAGVTGELVHRGGCIAKGYLNDSEKTAERFRTHPNYPGEILVYSGDLVVKDDEGFITFITRMDDMLKHNGIRISPTEIESIAENYDIVDAIVVFGIDNIDVGQDIILVYTTKKLQPLSEAKFRLYLKKHLPNHMQPKYIIYQKTFPVTGNQGKIDRGKVRDKVMSAFDQLI